LKQSKLIATSQRIESLQPAGIFVGVDGDEAKLWVSPFKFLIRRVLKQEEVKRNRGLAGGRGVVEAFAVRFYHS